MALKLRLILLGGLLLGSLLVTAQQKEWKEAFYANGNTRYKGYFIGKQPVGEVMQYYPSGQLKARLNYHGEETEAVIYSKDGEFTSSGKYLNRKKTGRWGYRKGERLLMQEEYAEDRLNGISRRYYSSGKVAEIRNWKTGILSGDWRMFYDNGQMKFATAFVEGKLEGPLKAYSYEGKLTVEGYYRNNLREGNWRYYDADGKLVRERIYRAGISDTQQEDDLKESEQIRQLETEAIRIVDPADFTDEPEVYMRIIDN